MKGLNYKKKKKGTCEIYPSEFTLLSSKWTEKLKICVLPSQRALLALRTKRKKIAFFPKQMLPFKP